ncbi:MULTISPECIES: xanthine dehydrogenase molybdopterin binding subunit [unclassified Ruegeria]|uniref:xanthine dehydrogenase molybdopterin binding subunit n=1 Tax=unclassified Ruegeria TaxID=2625375 RepID=UPI001492D609|nr:MULTISPECIES: xanthine dehydrogenase molybdopterin binding subunit [unclassified Ruegeria]NOD76682.1 xanthine dehydrogenase molybdopterin binding subunit [Ruegeria sp. HKCCD4332]NOD89402.1 xanthine dehydrogenase molybdopterin binding subunit [Ruegeria sp. HKCCD4318]NOE13435.1 xanthine dehydrogenase molybdopterin binding subunit [Ruegeria sp. HKCCD4318-2]NOG07816.1 xanthine dehydrogenase molybdopterin binding subunit [Ruegeria sp. HKCCD4315]
MSVTKPLPHDAAPLHVSGSARYVDDIPTPKGTLHLAFGISPIAKGKITAMDLSDVKAAEGVVMVMTAEDLPFANDVSPSIHDEPLLSDGTVHYIGQPVFLVVATSHLAARKAARLGKIDYAQETPILTVEEALAADSRFEDGPRIYAKGDADAAIAGAAHVIEGTFELGGQEHFYLEGQAALAEPNEGADMLVHSSTQHPTEIQHKVADALGVPMHAVRVETRRMGGGFGGKESQGNALAVACAVAARATGKACKMRYDRDDDMIITGKRHAFRISYKAGFDEHGHIQGVSFLHYAICGWAQDLSLPVADRAMLHSDNAYLLPNARIESHRLKTNTQSATAYRGFGGPQGMVGIERVMDHAAHELGLDPVELRRRNYYEPVHAVAEVAPREKPLGHPDPHEDLTSRGAVETGNAPVRALPAGGNTTPYGMEVSDFELHGMTDALLKSSDYAARKAAIAEWNAKNSVIKKGIAFSPVKFGISFTLTHLNQAGALVHVYQDGSVHLNHGGTEMGQGLFQKVAQVAASRFGIPLEMVKITATDTAKVPNTSATAASSGSDLNGMAVKAACDTIRDRMADYLAERHQADPSMVSFSDGHVMVGEEKYTFAEAAALTYQGRISLSATGFYKTPKIEWDRIAGRGRPFFYFAYGASVSEVAVDMLTGENRILRTDILHDAGASLNPALDIGQVEGGYVQGAGWLTTEELVWDGKGNLRTHAPSTYKIPACSDRPDIFNVALWDGANREDTIYRSKAVGEPPFMLGISAWLALSNAVAACGDTYPALDAPATAEEVWRGVQRMKGGI